MTFRLRFILAVALIFICFSTTSQAEKIWVVGRVLSADGKSPLRDTIVAVYDEKGHVVDYTRTADDGSYALEVQRDLLHLGKHGEDFLHQVTGGVGRLVGGVGGTLKAGLRAAGSVVSVGDPITRAGVRAGTALATGAMDVVFPRHNGRRADPLPGVLLMKATLPGRNDVIAGAKLYWMQQEVVKNGRREEKVTTAWIDPINLTRAGDEKQSTIESKYLSFKDARIEPGIAEYGQRVTISALIPTPPEPSCPVVVVARNNRTGKIYELTSRGEGTYTAEVEIDKHFPKDDQVFTVIAYAEQPDKPGRNKRVEGAIEGSGLFDPKREYIYNPLLVASRDRAELTLTVVQPPKRRR